MISDADIARTIGQVQWRYAGAPNDYLDYELRDVQVQEGGLDLELVQRDGHRARIQISLPSSGELQPWLYAPPVDSEDWVGQLLVWLDEEVFTLGLGESRARIVLNGASYVIVVPYGWKLTDEKRHAELLDATGPNGWHGGALDRY